ncbi:MAG: hypothetical protein FD173_84 [Gallionellaceae bacterium]|nr:MAG: hypothetical protein FD173_84 [Gallionellaceae bacterium]
MMPLTDITGLAGIALAVTALVLRLPVAARLQSGLQAWLASAILVALAIPFGGMSGAEYVRGITGDLSIATLALLLPPLVLPRTNGQAPSRAKILSEFNLTLLLLACAAVALYPMALGIGMFDPYRLGFGNLWFIAGLLFMASATWIRQYTLIALGLSLAVLAWSVGWYESNNLWDYLLDPWVSVYALAVLIKRGASMAAKRLFPPR